MLFIYHTGYAAIANDLSFSEKIVNDCQIKRFRLPKRQSTNSNKTFSFAIISILAIENVDFGNRKRKIVYNSAFTIAAYLVCLHGRVFVMFDWREYFGSDCADSYSLLTMIIFIVLQYCTEDVVSLWA